MTDNLVACPKCDGSCRRPVPDDLRKYTVGEYAERPLIAGYDKATDTLACDNCGGQTMSGRGTGMVRTNPLTGNGCMHSYRSLNAGRCLTEYVCKFCQDRFVIDSGD